MLGFDAFKRLAGQKGFDAKAISSETGIVWQAISKEVSADVRTITPYLQKGRPKVGKAALVGRGGLFTAEAK